MDTLIFKPQQKWLEHVSFFSLLLFAISIFAYRGINRPIEVIFILSIIFSLKHICTYEKSNKGLWVYLLILASFLMVLLSNYIATFIYPSLEVNHNKYSMDYIRILFFVFVGWWVIKQPNIIWLLLALLSLGFSIQVITSDDFLRLLSEPRFSRLDFGLTNAQHTAAFSGSLLIAGIALSPLILTIKHTGFKVLVSVLTFTAVLLMSVVTLLSQTRGIWLGLFIVAGTLVMPWAMLFIGKGGPHIRLKLSACFVTCIIAVFILGSFSPVVNSRVERTIDDILHFSKMELKDIPTTSTGIRIHQWALAIELIKDRPIAGHGGGASKYLIRASDIPHRARATFGHFHNSYLELGAAHGLGAPFIFIFILGYLLYRLIKAYKKNQIGPELFFWGISWVIFFAVINIFESYVRSRSGYVLMFIIGGIIYGMTSKPYNNRTQDQ